MDKRINQLLEQIQQDQTEAMNELYERSRHGVYAFILPYIRDHQLAEDILQETYLKIFQHVGSYKKNTNGLNWMLTIAKNTALNAIVKRNREEQIDPVNESYRFPAVKETVVVDAPTIELAKRVLDEQEQQIIYLFAIAEYKHREIALMLDLPLGTVTWKYNQAIKKMKEALKGGPNHERKRHPKQD